MTVPTVRTRYCPSPTGYLHLGGARTALYSYLYARRNGGAFVVRIEDTDVGRNVERGAEEIAEALRWLGLNWDEGIEVGGPNGPYTQSERLGRYREVVERMLAAGEAYRCWCTAEELAERRRAAEAASKPPGYDGRCRDLPEQVVRGFEAGGRDFAVRFRLPREGETVVEDLVRGTTRFDNSALSDFVILRSSGMPTYVLANACDDFDEHITHIIRGEDLFPATPNQVHVLRALGAESPPVYGHLPLLIGPNRKKLSKRFGDVAVQSFRAKGYLAEAMVNYLALLGWSLDDHTEYFRLADLERVFSIERVTRNPAMFDTAKLDALNGFYLRELAAEDFAERTAPFLAVAGLPDDRAALEVVEQAAPLVQERVTRLDEVPAMVGFLFGDEVELDQAAAVKVLTADGRAFLSEAAGVLGAMGSWTAPAIEAVLRELQQARGLGAKKAFQPIRLAVTGKLVSPPLFESMELLGKERSLARIRAALAAGSPAAAPVG